MDELREILANPGLWDYIKDNAVWNELAQVYEFKEFNIQGKRLQASGRTKEKLLKNMLNGIRLILRDKEWQLS